MLLIGTVQFYSQIKSIDFAIMASFFRARALTFLLQTWTTTIHTIVWVYVNLITPFAKNTLKFVHAGGVMILNMSARVQPVCVRGLRIGIDGLIHMGTWLRDLAGTLKGGTLNRVVWYFEEGGMVF